MSLGGCFDDHRGERGPQSLRVTPNDRPPLSGREPRREPPKSAKAPKRGRAAKAAPGWRRAAGRLALRLGLLGFVWGAVGLGLLVAWAASTLPDTSQLAQPDHHP